MDTPKPRYKRPRPPAGLRLHIWLNAELEQQFRAYCEAMDMTPAAAGRAIIEQFLRRESPLTDDKQLLMAICRAIDHLEAEGLPQTGREAMATAVLKRARAG